MGDSNENEIRKRKLDAYGSGKEAGSSPKDTDDSSKEEQRRKRCFVIYIPKKLIYLSICIGIAAVLWNLISKSYFSQPDDEILYGSLGQEGLNLFRKYDRDGNDQLSIGEYEALYLQLIGNGMNISEFEYNPVQEIDSDDQIVTLHGYFKPLLLNTMTKDMDEGYFGNMDSLSGLKEWTKLNIESLNFGVRHFKVFLPTGSVHVGNVYELYSGTNSFLSSISTPHLSSNRFYPSKVEDDLVVLHRMLMLFHSRPFLRTRFPPMGGVACVRAFNEEYIEIVFRFHAEFQLNEPPYNPFWFTPGQFTGTLIISRDYSMILYFDIHVPNEKKLNVDMEWLNGPNENENMEVDIGFMPEMMANITASSLQNHPQEFPIETDERLREKIDNIVWSEEIPLEDVLRKLEVRMYPFKQVPYYNFTETVKKAQEKSKLIHCILLWGALDDQSC